MGKDVQQNEVQELACQSMTNLKKMNQVGQCTGLFAT
jgi:hypothetical protein